MQRGMVARSFDDLKRSDVREGHSIELKDEEAICMKGYRLSPRDNIIVRKELEKMLRAGIWTPASSAWSLPVVIATNKDGQPRFCVENRARNQEMKPKKWPIPKPPKIFDDLSEMRVFSSLDISSGYWQICMSDDCKDMTTLACKFGSFKLEVMQFGLINAPFTFQRMMYKVFSDLSYVQVYLDDIVVASETIVEHVGHLREVLKRIEEAGLKIKVSKCEFAEEEMELLVRRVSEYGVKVDRAKVTAIESTPRPSNQTELCRLLRLAGYYRRFIRVFSEI